MKPNPIFETRTFEMRTEHDLARATWIVFGTEDCLWLRGEQDEFTETRRVSFKRSGTRIVFPGVPHVPPFFFMVDDESMDFVIGNLGLKSYEEPTTSDHERIKNYLERTRITLERPADGNLLNGTSVTAADVFDAICGALSAIDVGDWRLDSEVFTVCNRHLPITEMGLYTIHVPIARSERAELKMWVVPLATSAPPTIDSPMFPAPEPQNTWRDLTPDGPEVTPDVEVSEEQDNEAFGAGSYQSREALQEKWDENDEPTGPVPFAVITLEDGVSDPEWHIVRANSREEAKRLVTTQFVKVIDCLSEVELSVHLRRLSDAK